MRPVLAILAFALLAREGRIEYALGKPRVAVVPAVFVTAGDDSATFEVPEGARVARVVLSFAGTAPGGVRLLLDSPGGSAFESSTGPGGATAELEVEAPEPGEWALTVRPVGPVRGVDWTVEIAFE